MGNANNCIISCENNKKYFPSVERVFNWKMFVTARKKGTTTKVKCKLHSQ